MICTCIRAELHLVVRDPECGSSEHLRAEASSITSDLLDLFVLGPLNIGVSALLRRITMNGARG